MHILLRFVKLFLIILIIYLPCQMWVQCLGQEDSLEKGMATHSSILAWGIPWTEEPGALQSMWSQSHILPKQLCCTCGIGLKFLLLQIVAKIWYAKLFKLFCFWWDKIISCSNFNWISLFQMKLSLHEYVYFPFLLLFCWLVIFNFCEFFCWVVNALILICKSCLYLLVTNNCCLYECKCLLSK